MLKFPGDTWLEAKKKVNNKEDQNSIWDMTAKQWRESRVIIARMNQRSQTVWGLQKLATPYIVATGVFWLVDDF